MEVFSSRSANGAWLSAANALSERGRATNSRIGDTRELLHAAFVIAEPHERWVVSRLPALNPAFALAEVVWILSGRSDSRFVAHWNPGLLRFVGNATHLHGAYGIRLRETHGVDQLQSAYQTLTDNPSSRQVVLQIWSAGIDLPDTQGQPRSEDIPCNISCCLKVRDGKLHWLQTLRSNDVFLGVPHNVVQFTMIQEIMAGWLKVGVGEYVQMTDSLHLYDHDGEAMRIDKQVIPAENTDRFRECFDDSSRHIEALASLMDTLIDGSPSERSTACESGLNLPSEYANMFAVIAADDYRRRGDSSRACDLMHHCTNPAYHQLWQRWCERKQSKMGAQVGNPRHIPAHGIVSP